MSKKNKIFALAIAVLLLALTAVGSVSAVRLYQIDFSFDDKRETFVFTAVKDANYYEIRGFAPGDTVSKDAGTLLATYVPDTPSTGGEFYSVPLNQTPSIIDKASLAVLKTKPYYTLVVYAYKNAAPVYHSVNVTSQYCSYSNDVVEVLEGSTFSVTFVDEVGGPYYGYKTYYGKLTVTMGGVDITGPAYGQDGNNTLQVVHADDRTHVTVNNVSGDLVISMTAALPPVPDSLDTPYVGKSGENLIWDEVDNATEYLVEIKKGSTSATLLNSTYVTGGSLNIASYVTDLDKYYARVTACYNTDIVTSAPSDWIEFDFTNVPANAPLMEIDYSSVDDTFLGESNPLTFIGSGSGTCNKPHIIDSNGDGYDDSSYSAGYDAGISYQTNVSGDSGVADFFTKILGAITGAALYVGNNVKVAGISLIAIAGILAVGVAIAILFSFKKGG